jgi:glycine/D-amino acid oxidase-like deaminating enzyme/nitrite reductase/ring-hydroxylating ferredoxin subunit
MFPPRGTTPIWRPRPSTRRTPDSLPRDVLDAIVVGGGVSGLTSALLLQRHGLTTAIFEQDRIGGGESGRTSAHLTTYPDVGFARLTDDFGFDGARAVASSLRGGLDLIERLAAEIECGFERVPAFLYTERDDDRERLQYEFDAAQAMVMASRLWPSAPLPFPTAGALELSAQAQCDPVKYLSGLDRLYTAAGGCIVEGVRVVAIADEGDRCRVTTIMGSAYARRVIAVTGAPITASLVLDTHLRANRTYVVAARIRPSCALPHGLFWDTDAPYHYLRTARTAQGALLLVGGEDHRTGADGEREAIARLETFVRSRFDVEQIVAAWSGQIEEPVDGLPYIGPREEGSHVYVASGYGGTGLTFATVAAQILSATIAGERCDHAHLYALGRAIPEQHWATYAAQNLAAAWALVSDPAAHSDGAAISQLKPGEGLVVQLEGERVAVARDTAGLIHAVSAICQHLGCDVAWNAVEQTWDCPCHGSRYDVDGRPLNGPTTEALQPLAALMGHLPQRPR